VPIYEYQCSKCGEVFEAFQKISDNPLNECKFCQGKVERLISQSSFQLKGSGWYLTDYARKSSSGDTSAPKSGEKSEDKSTSSESKPSTPPAKSDKTD
jgi:putative FmdB family regulatory protein